MYQRISVWITAFAALLVMAGAASAQEPKLSKAFIDGTGPGWRALGKSDFVNVNCADDTWTWKEDGSVHCTGKPTGVIRSVKEYKNLEVVAEWRHLSNAGNSGIFVWSPKASLDRLKGPGLPHGIEVQVLDLGYTKFYEEKYKKASDWFTCHGDVFPVGSAKMTPFPPVAPNGKRSFPSKNLSKGTNEWNHYYIRAIDGEVRLWVNGEEVSGGSNCDPATGFLCLESEGAPVEFRNLRLRELPAGGDGGKTAGISKSMTFLATFDKGLDADVAKGKGQLHTKKGEETHPGNLTEDAVRIAEGKGRNGSHALEFTKKIQPWLFYPAAGNLAYSEANWAGTVSFWLKLDPEEQLEPGYCDPLLVTPRAWNDAAFFCDFNKDGDPRDFRLGAFADKAVWNPEGKDVPEPERPLFSVEKPPFGRDQWTHVAFTWTKFNTGEKNGVATFYLNGKSQGAVSGWNQKFSWRKDEEARIYLGINYVGLFDELTCFDRALSADEIALLNKSNISEIR